MSSSLYISIQEKSVNNAIQPIMEPEPIVFSFETIGWTILLWIVIIIIAIIVSKSIHSYRNNKYKRDAIKVLENINLNNELEANRQIAMQLKLVAMQSFGRESIAPLSGKEWISFLQSKSKNKQFSHLDDFLLECLYQNKTNLHKSKEFLTYSKQWIQSHA